jgi:hypothetical protein
MMRAAGFALAVTTCALGPIACAPAPRENAMLASPHQSTNQFDLVAVRLFGVALTAPDARDLLQRATPATTPHHDEQRDARSGGAVRSFAVDIYPEQHAELHWSTAAGGPLAMAYLDYPEDGVAIPLAAGLGLDSTTGPDAAAQALDKAPGVSGVERSGEGITFTANGFRTRLHWSGGRIVAAVLARSPAR